MADKKHFDVIIIGGSYSGLAAGMALGRALREVLIIDSGKPCNMQTPYSHNFLTQDGVPPDEIATLAKKQLAIYNTVQFFNGLATKGIKTATGFQIYTETGEVFNARKVVFGTGIKDIMPDIAGFAESWGISVLHCPYCHGYEVRGEKTGILGNGNYGFEFSALISNWTKDLTLYTNGQSTLTTEQTAKLQQHHINIVEDEIKELQHLNGCLQHILFKSGKAAVVKAIYARTPFTQHCPIPEMLGCILNDDGYLKVDLAQNTSVHGVFACGDNTTRMRTVANSVSMGTTAGLMVNKELIDEAF
ncbi:MAG: NAD(P)/FAD-dependent oxidoreductase [Ferruginibacter sp.]